MREMTIQLQTDGNKCLYEQIYEHIKKEIREGKLLAGERLPSRVLGGTASGSADHGGIITQLLSEGYIEARPYKGYFVCALEELMQLKRSRVHGGFRRQENFKEERHSKAGRFIPGAEGIERGTGKDFGVREENTEEESCIREILYDFSPNGIDMTGFPFSVWKKITKNILNDGNSELFSQGEPQGDYDLRLTISRYLHSSRGVDCTGADYCRGRK